MMLVRFLLALLFCVGATPPVSAQGASTWFLAEGASNGTFDEDILVGNPSSSALTVTVKLLPAPDAVITPGTVLEKPFALPATGRLTVNLKRDFLGPDARPGINGAASAQVSAVLQGTSTPADIVVERSMFFPLTGTPYAGGTGASGVVAPATRWILAEGSGGIFETFILVVNPGGGPANVTLTYLAQDGRSAVTQRTIAAGQRATFWANVDHPVLSNQGFSTVVTSDVPVVAERAMYFDQYRSGHDALGIAVTGSENGRTTWYFAEGFTGANPGINTAFETFLLIGNNNEQPVTVTATYFLDAGTPVQKTYTVGPRSRFNIWVDEEKAGDGSPLFAPAAFSVRLESTLPIVAERAMYWGTPQAGAPNTPAFPWREGHVVAGIEQPAPKWAFAEGRQGEDGSGGSFDSFFLLVNPNPAPVTVRAVFATEDGTGFATTLPLTGNTRGNIWPAAGLAEFAVLQGRRFAVFLETVEGLPVVAERAMYWNAYVGGHANAGTPWTGAISVPAQRPVDVQVTGMTPTSGRLTGGTTVTISGQHFSAGAQLSFGGQPVPYTRAADGSSLTFTVPLRSTTTGYGTAGPSAVTIVDQGRFVRAPSFTRYFTVLAFGDSLTYGTYTYYIAGQKISTQVSRPYPRELKTLLSRNPQFGQYALVTNAGWPGEWVTASGFNSSPGGVARAARCTAGQQNCFYPQSPDPRDYFAPFDIALLLEGINDLNNLVAPATVRNGMRSMVIDAKAKGAQVLLELFQSYGIDQVTGQPATYPEKVSEYNALLDALAVEQSVFRERHVGIDMGPDGLHPNQTGYEEMAAIVYDKIRDIFRRCPAGQASCP